MNDHGDPQLPFTRIVMRNSAVVSHSLLQSFEFIVVLLLD